MKRKFSITYLKLHLSHYKIMSSKISVSLDLIQGVGCAFASYAHLHHMPIKTDQGAWKVTLSADFFGVQSYHFTDQTFRKAITCFPYFNFQPTWCFHFSFLKIFTFNFISLFLCVFHGNAAKGNTSARPK